MAKPMWWPCICIVLLVNGCSDSSLSLSNGTYVLSSGPAEPSRVEITVLDRGRFRIVPHPAADVIKFDKEEGTIRGDKLAWKWGHGEDEAQFEGRLTDNNKATGTVKVIKQGKYEMHSDTWSLAKE